ncbi:MAG TPA: D-aminoacylase [Saprospiraceae bacterium]|nr:D-aminoacylase [Saprospiraceae bacterium]
MRPIFFAGIFLLLFSACQTKTSVDLLIINAQIIDGTGSPVYPGAVAINADTLVWIGSDPASFKATQTIDAKGKILSPGFIDPHTHTLSDLQHPERKANLNYLVQGVTTVVNGNDGYGQVEVRSVLQDLESEGIGTNAALYVGHRPVRQAVMGMDRRAPTAEELTQMKALVKKGMEQGALGFSSGLFYAPASFSTTGEVVALAEVAAQYGGLYDVHMRDESSYNIGLLASVDETIEIARRANIRANIAHIKALGLDVWGESQAVIAKVEEAQAEGLLITADQYPFEASSTSIKAALVPKWVLGNTENYLERFEDPDLLPRIKAEMRENLRRRGGAEAVLLTDAQDSTLNGSTLQAMADIRQLHPIDAAIEVLRSGGSSIASFNMQESDIKNFMEKDWVMTSSDGGSPHPRKYASFAKKIRKYVLEDQVLSLPRMIHQSSGMTAEVLGIPKRGFLKPGYYADLIVFDPAEVQDYATFRDPAQLSTGMSYVLVNGEIVIKEGQFQHVLAGRPIYRR